MTSAVEYYSAMSPERLRKVLEGVRSGGMDIEQALTAMKILPFEEVADATIDHHRALRQGVPEVVFGAGKSTEQLLTVAETIVAAGHRLLITRLDPSQVAPLKARFPMLHHAEKARLVRLEATPAPQRPCPPVAVICAGTSDIPVAEEAVETLAAVGLAHTRIYDVGVAGIHRLLAKAKELAEASAVIVIAGMEGALPTVVGGMVACPIVAVPTSVGYGAALGGFTALMGMLTSCASGLTVVNIDNGFGAAMAIHRMLPASDVPANTDES